MRLKWLVVVIVCMVCLAGVAVATSRGQGSAYEWRARTPDMGAHDPTVIALSKAAAYNVFDAPVLLQHQYSRRGALTVLLCAFERGDRRLKAVKGAEWEIRVEFPDFPDLKNPRLTATNAPKAKGSGGKRGAVTAVQVVTAGVACLTWTEGTITGPVVITNGRDKDGYWTFFERLPFTPGAHTRVGLSRDLKRYRILPGQ